MLRDRRTSRPDPKEVLLAGRLLASTAAVALLVFLGVGGAAAV